MTTTSRRVFLQSGAIAAVAGAASAEAPPPKSDEKPRFRLGIVTYQIAAEWDVPTIVKICHAVGLSPVELRTGHKHGVEPSISKERRQEVRKQFEDGGVQIWGCGTTCEFQSPDPLVVSKNIETCKQFLQLSADLGGRGVKVRPNGLPKDVPVEKTLEQIGKALADCGKAAADLGLEVWLEVHGPGTAHPPHIKTIMQHCGRDNVGCTWNSNATDLVNGSVSDSFHLLRPWIKSCHINELWKDEKGIYPYRELFRLMRETNYDRVTLCEVARGMPTPDAGEELLRYYRALWQELATERH